MLSHMAVIYALSMVAYFVALALLVRKAPG